MIKTVKIDDNTAIGSGCPLALIAGPCVMEESSSMLHEVGSELSRICRKLGIAYVFKTSYDKANRSSIDSYRGPGIKEALPLLSELKARLQVPLLLDIHTPDEAPLAAEVADIVQVPAFLCRQTDLLVAAGKTGKAVNIKKGQFLAPRDIGHAAAKVESAGNSRILLTERGYAFGYNNLVVDMRSIMIMKETGFPVVFDATHSVQLPGARGGVTSGQREFVPLLSQAAVAAGANAVFMEVHPDPGKALCDASNQLPLDRVEELLVRLAGIYRTVNHD